MTNTQLLIKETCDQIKELLIEKNRKYGDSAVNPIRILSKSSNTEQILVRIDDKLNRIKNMQSDEDEDVITDLIGYLVLYKVAKKINDL
jgi:hypothetical protein